MLTRILSVALILSFARPSFAEPADLDRFRSLNLLYSLTQVCYAARKGKKSQYVTRAQFTEAKVSYSRQVSLMGLTGIQKSKIENDVKRSEELAVMSSLIRSGSAVAINKKCGQYRVAIILSEYGF